MTRTLRGAGTAFLIVGLLSVGTPGIADESPLYATAGGGFGGPLRAHAVFGLAYHFTHWRENRRVTVFGEGELGTGGIAGTGGVIFHPKGNPAWGLGLRAITGTTFDSPLGVPPRTTVTGLKLEASPFWPILLANAGVVQLGGRGPSGVHFVWELGLRIPLGWKWWLGP